MEKVSVSLSVFLSDEVGFVVVVVVVAAILVVEVQRR